MAKKDKATQEKTAEVNVDKLREQNTPEQSVSRTKLVLAITATGLTCSEVLEAAGYIRDVSLISNVPVDRIDDVIPDSGKKYFKVKATKAKKEETTGAEDEPAAEVTEGKKAKKDKKAKKEKKPKG